MAAAASLAEREMNLSALQQRDPYITGIADSASQVAVYSFNSNLNEWEKTNVEGTLFVYSRSAYPTNGFMIINRLHLNDLIEPINKNLEFQLQDPFLLYRNEKAAIYGIWFYDRDECARIGQLMNSLVQIAIETQQKETASGRQRRASESDTTSDARSSEAGKGIDAVQKNVDILQMLSKAQDEYDKSKAQVLRKSSTPTVTTNGNCAAGVGACSASPKTKLVKGGMSAKCAEPNSAMLDGVNSGGGVASAKAVKVLRPTAVKPPPLLMDLSKPGGCPDPSTTPNTQISLEVLFKRAVLQQEGNQQSNAYRRQQSAAPMVPTVAQLMSTQTGTTTVEELERQHHSNTHRSKMSRAPAAEASSAAMANGPANNAVMGFSCISTSMPGEPESPNTMLRRTLNLGPSSSDGLSQGPSRQAAISQNCADGVALRNSSADAPRRNEGAERKASSNAEAVANQNRTSAGMSQVISLSSPLGLPNLPSTLTASSSIPSASTIFGQVGPTLARLGTNNLKGMGESSGASPFGGICWSNSPQSDVLAPPETFQTAALKNDGANILLSPMVFQTSAGLSALNQVRMPEPLLLDLQSGTSNALRDRSPLGTCGEPVALPLNLLTRDQLQQALIHLLKNDSSFLGAIHEAYIASLNQELGSKTTRP